MLGSFAPPLLIGLTVGACVFGSLVPTFACSLVCVGVAVELCILRALVCVCVFVAGAEAFVWYSLFVGRLVVRGNARSE
jgi:hypothetical protein